jgi:hypothetical protein
MDYCIDGKCHKFYPRYNESPINTKIETNVDPKFLRSLLVYKTYVCDVCIKCGKVVSYENK